MRNILECPRGFLKGMFAQKKWEWRSKADDFISWNCCFNVTALHLPIPSRSLWTKFCLPWEWRNKRSWKWLSKRVMGSSALKVYVLLKTTCSSFRVTHMSPNLCNRVLCCPLPARRTHDKSLIWLFRTSWLEMASKPEIWLVSTLAPPPIE